MARQCKVWGWVFCLLFALLPPLLLLVAPSSPSTNAGAQSCLRVQRGVRRQGQVEAADRGAGGDAHRRGRRRARAHGRQRRDPSAGAAGQPQRRRQARSAQCPARCCLATSPQLRFAGAVRVIANRRVEVARPRAAGFRRPGRVGGGCQAPRAAQPCLPPPTRRCRISPGRQP